MKQLLTLCFAVVGLLTGQAALAASGDSAMLNPEISLDIHFG